VDLADLVVDTRVIEDALGRRRLARVDVGHDADVAGAFERVFAGHGELQEEGGRLRFRGPRRTKPSPADLLAFSREARA
jgi:hypothetical protein